MTSFGSIHSIKCIFQDKNKTKIKRGHENEMTTYNTHPLTTDSIAASNSAIFCIAFALSGGETWVIIDLKIEEKMN